MQNKNYIWLLPFLAALIGLLILVLGWWERQKAMSDIGGLFDGHVRSIAALIDESTREAAASTALIYELSEEHLHTAAHLLSALRNKDGLGKLADDSWKIYLLSCDNGYVAVDWGPVPEAEQADFLDFMIENEKNLVDGGLAEKYHLLCYSDVTPDCFDIVCRDSGSLEKLKSEVGLSKLLKRVIRQDVVYVAIQDASGVLAAAPSAAGLSSWRDDPLLESTLQRSESGPVTRFIAADRPVFEGLTPFNLPDGTLALLRIGIDGSALARLQDNSLKRYSLMAALVAGFMLLSFVLALTLQVWRRKQKAAEDLLALREEERRHWETIGQMAATVAHEVRNPLNTLGMISQRLGREFDLPQAQRPEFEQMLGLLQSESERVNRVVTDFLELGRPLKINAVAADAAELLNAALLPSRLRAEKENKILKQEIACEGNILMDAKLFQHICGNLLGNAFDALPSGGEVLVSARREGTDFVLIVADKGAGIAADQIENIMKPFVSFKSNGTGLGLPLVKRYVEALGGKFTLSSAPGEGARAVVRIPAAFGKNGNG